MITKGWENFSYLYLYFIFFSFSELFFQLFGEIEVCCVFSGKDRGKAIRLTGVPPHIKVRQTIFFADRKSACHGQLKENKQQFPLLNYIFSWRLNSPTETDKRRSDTAVFSLVEAKIDSSTAAKSTDQFWKNILSTFDLSVCFNRFCKQRWRPALFCGVFV